MPEQTTEQATTETTEAETTDDVVEPDTDDANPESGITDESTEETEDDEDAEGVPHTYSREYVGKLRRESANYRTKARDRDDLAGRLHTAIVAATGRLADPTDLPFDEAHLEDAEALTAALDELVERKPHLASRRVAGDVGQGATGVTEGVDLAGMLRARAS